MKIIVKESQLKKLINIIKEDISDDKLNVLFVGDSLSAGPSYTWNYKLANKHSNDWYSEHLVKGGERTSWMLDELRQKLKQKKYDLVFIYGGTNDMFSLVSISQAINNINQMVKLVEAQGGEAIVFAGYDAESVMSEKKHSNGGNLAPTKYCNEQCMLKSRSRMIEFQNELLNDISGKNVIVIPKMPGGSTSWTSDGIHVKSSIHDKMSNYVNGYISGKFDSKEKEKNWDFGFNFLDGFKKYLSNYFSSTFGSLSKQKKITNKFISNLEKITEHNINNYKILNENKIIQKGDSGDNVTLIQVALQLLGYSFEKWGIDGIFGLETKQAVKEFQKDNNLEPTGKITKKTKNEIIKNIKKEVTDEDFSKINFTKFEGLPTSKATLSGNYFENIALNKYGEEFLNKVKTISDEIGLDYKIILAIMNFESGMNHRAVNTVSDATGLIQFMPFTAKSLGTSTYDLKNMSALKQLDYVKKFFNLHKRLIPSIKSPEDAYFLVFYPAATTRDDSFILGSEVSNERAKLIAKQNPMDRNGDGVLSKGEVKSKIRQKWGI